MIWYDTYHHLSFFKSLIVSLISENPPRDVALLLVYYLGKEQKNSEVSICPSHHNGSYPMAPRQVWGFFRVPSISSPIIHWETNETTQCAYELTGYSVSHIRVVRHIHVYHLTTATMVFWVIGSSNNPEAVFNNSQRSGYFFLVHFHSAKFMRAWRQIHSIYLWQYCRVLPQVNLTFPSRIPDFPFSFNKPKILWDYEPA